MSVDTDFDPIRRRMYIADSKSEMIHIINTEEESVERVPETTNPTAIAVDWLRNNIYWIDGRKNEVDMSLTNGRFRRVVIPVTLHLLDIALDVEKGYLFYSRSGIFASINRCNLDGSDCESIINQQIEKPTSLAILREGDQDKIFWCDSDLKSIESADFDGDNRFRILHNHMLFNPLKLFVTSEKLYWTERQSKMLNWINMQNYSHINSLPLEYEEPQHGEWFMSATMQGDRIDKTFPCKGKCEQLCFSTYEEEKCGCADGLKLTEDGITCSPIGCHEDQFECKEDGSCIPKAFKCDRDQDCPEGSDEKNCTVECPADKFQCSDKLKCVDLDEVCDSFRDCADHSDEKEERCSNKTCNIDRDFSCKSGHCIPTDWRCDGKEDCADSSDEQNCEDNSCTSDRFNCSNGRCISKFWVCDNENDCGDGADEKNCPCVLGEFTCDDGSCIASAMLCDGSENCPDKSDESPKHCLEETKHPGCPMNERPCSSIDSSQCFPISAWCDGTHDCTNGEDERNCTVHCPKDYVLCTDGYRCVPKSWICDGHFDCSDESDEHNCNKYQIEVAEEKECRSDQYQCRDGQCINQRQLCDGIDDCTHGDDEVKECDKCSKNKGGCQHICVNDVKRISCKCNPGFSLASDLTSCLDINECLDEYICDHQCVNKKGSYACKCNEGYRLVDDSKCKPENGYHWLLVTKAQNSLKYLDGQNSARIVGSINITQAEMTYDPIKKELFVLDSPNGRILRLRDSKWEVVMEKIENGRGISLDYINRNIYFGESSIINHGGKTGEHLYSDIKICHLDNGFCHKIIEVHNKNITSVAISSQNLRLFYCANTRDSGEIVAMKLDGKKQIFVEKEKVMQCSSILVHEHRKRIYWIDQKLNVIESISFSGHGRHKLPYNKVHKAYGLSIIDHGLAWINRERQDLVRCTLVNPKGCREVYFKGSYLLGSIPPVIFSNVPTPCNETICDEDQICAPYSETTPTCLCPYNVPFGPNSKCEDEGLGDSLRGSCAHSPCHKGECKYESPDKIKCICPKNRRGLYCEIGWEMKIEGSSSGNIVALVVIFILLGLLLCAFFVLYKKHPRKFSNLKLWKGGSGLSKRFSFKQASSGILQDENESLPPTPKEMRPKPKQESRSVQIECIDDSREDNVKMGCEEAAASSKSKLKLGSKRKGGNFDYVQFKA